MSEEERNYHIETKCQLKAGAHQDAFGSLSVPIYQTGLYAGFQSDAGTAGSGDGTSRGRQRRDGVFDRNGGD